MAIGRPLSALRFSYLRVALPDPAARACGRLKQGRAKAIVALPGTVRSRSFRY